MRNATLNASVSALTPKILEINMSRTSPVTRDTKVRPLTVATARSNVEFVGVGLESSAAAGLL
jgi:hypothetical protein